MRFRRGQIPAAGIIAAVMAAGVVTAASHGRPRVGGSVGAAAVQGTHAPIVFTGGYETDSRDRGRPVVLIAAALGVPADVFREAFRHVRPAPAGSRPEPEQVRANKAALLDALGRYGVTNDRLDTVSNFYRYNRSRGEWWPTRPASGYAVVENGVITRYVITDGGSGYSSPPTVTVPSVPGSTATARLSFSTSFDRNGAVASVTAAGSGR